MLSITEDVFGSAVDPMTQQVDPVRRFTFTNDCGMVVQVITLGATITSIQVPDKGGKVDDVVLGYDDIASFLNEKINPYFGATVGRVANRIGNGRFKIDGVEYAVSRNHQGKHTLHGGAVGFNKAHWTVQELDKENCVLVLKHVSPDNDQGFPGEVTTRARFQLSSDNRLTVKYTATTTKPTPINMTNHAYFNLAGHQTGSAAIYDHLIAINADKLTLTDGDSIPTGEFLDVKGSAFDFKDLKKLGPQITKSAGSGFDQNYCCNLDDNKVTVVARAVHLESGRYMEVSTDQPGVQFYTSNFMPDTANGEQPFPGKGGASYSKHGAFCFEPQGYPDAVNHPNFPNTILRPGKTYEHNIVFQFGVTRGLEHSQWLRKF